ncbi:MAG: YopX family protein [bacterium]
MKSKIKFRGWIIRQNRMISWEEISSSKQLLFSFFGDEEYKTNPPIKIWERMQFTGLKDKNGVDIFEGDVLLILDTLKIVVDFKAEENTIYGHGDSVTSLMVGFKLGSQYGKKYDFNEVEILGNIYENPELIK